jgi:hypothetical protein
VVERHFDKLNDRYLLVVELVETTPTKKFHFFYNYLALPNSRAAFRQAQRPLDRLTDRCLLVVELVETTPTKK